MTNASLSRLDSLDEEDDDEEGRDLLGRRIVRRERWTSTHEQMRATLVLE